LELPQRAYCTVPIVGTCHLYLHWPVEKNLIQKGKVLNMRKFSFAFHKI